MTSRGLHARVLRTSEDLAAVEEPWRELWAAAGGEYYASYGFVEAAWRLVERPGGAEPAVAWVEDADGVVGAVPLVVDRRAGIRRARPLAARAADELAWVAASHVDAADVVTVGADAVADAVGVDVDWFTVVPDGSAVGDRLAASGWSVVGSDVTTRAVLSAEDDWASYAASLGKLSGRKPGRVLRRLASEGAVSRRVLDAGTDDVAVVVHWLLEQKRRWAETTGRSGAWLASAEFERLLLELVTRPDPQAPAEVFVTELDGRPVSAVLSGLGGGVLTGLVSAFDQDLPPQLRVGAVGWEGLVQDALERGLDVDFGVGHESFKRYYARGRQREVRSWARGRTWRGRAAVAWAARRRGDDGVATADD